MSLFRAFVRFPLSVKSVSPLFTASKSFSSQPPPGQSYKIVTSPNANIEPVERYVKDQYHPVNLGDYLKSGRYKVLHKLGWGGWSTVWAARDESIGAYVAVKIAVAQAKKDSGKMEESQIMQQVESHCPSHDHVIQMLDHFNLQGPNGSHECLVYELLGPSIRDTQLSVGRLSGKVAKTISKQILIGLDALHQKRIGHGDLHSRNVVFTFPNVNHLTEAEFLEVLGTPIMHEVRRSDGKGLPPGIPEYLVEPTSCRIKFSSTTPVPPIKIVDFGESFLPTAIPPTLGTPLLFRAPEVFFHERFDYRVDLWSLGCLLFEIFTGVTAIPSVSQLTDLILIGQMRALSSDDLPKRWQLMYGMRGKPTDEWEGSRLQEDLKTVYNFGYRKPDLTEEDLERLGRIISRLLYFEPSARASAREIFADPWWDE